MPNDLTGLLRDLLVIGYLFVLRVGVPLLLTLLLGAWLQKVLQAPEQAPQPTADSLSAGHRCWDVKHCPPALRVRCAAAQQPNLPCWLALQVSGEGLREACYTCPLFTSRAPAAAH